MYLNDIKEHHLTEQTMVQRNWKTSSSSVRKHQAWQVKEGLCRKHLTPEVKLFSHKGERAEDPAMRCKHLAMTTHGCLYSPSSNTQKSSPDSRLPCLGVEGLFVRRWSNLLRVDPDMPDPILLWDSYLPYIPSKHHPAIQVSVMPLAPNGCSFFSSTP